MSNYRIAELDFDDIKTNLKNFLKNYRDKNNNLIFSDFDFDSSSLSILLDVLSYNTHYNAYLANMVANEMFLDSAVKRESAVSIAKHLGYTPLSFRSARAKLDFVLPTPDNLPSTVTLPKYTPFTTTIENTIFTFVNLDSVIIKPENGVYRFSNVEIVEGEPLTYTYRVDVGGPQEKYTIPNKNIDTSTIRVTVQKSFTDLAFSTFEKAENLTAVNSLSKVFYVEQNPSGFYEVFFGDGTLGQKLEPGNLVIIEYLVSNGSLANVSDKITQLFSLGTTISGQSLSAPIIAVSNSTGGDEEDTIEEIKFKAPKFLSSYNRAVTANDYKAIINANYPLIESIAVWGGEDNDPPRYGKVMISLKPYEGYTVNDEVKSVILNKILADKKVMSIIPEFVDPNYLFVQLTTNVRFDAKNSRYTAKELQTLVKFQIEKYFSQELQKFDRDFVYSKLSKTIDDADQSIVGNITTFKIQKRIQPTINSFNGYVDGNTIRFTNKLVSGSIRSSYFFYRTETNEIKTVYMGDVLTKGSTSAINLYDSVTNAILLSNLGSINYDTGTISITSLNPAGYLENSEDIRIYAVPASIDLFTTRDLIMVIDDSLQDVKLGIETGLTINVSQE
jgi:hypothetical protein